MDIYKIRNLIARNKLQVLRYTQLTDYAICHAAIKPVDFSWKYFTKIYICVIVVANCTKNTSIFDTSYRIETRTATTKLLSSQTHIGN